MCAPGLTSPGSGNLAVADAPHALRGGAHVDDGLAAAVTPTPLEWARRALASDANNAVAALVVRAAGPWSPATHELFADEQRAEAASLAPSLYHVYSRRMGGGWQAKDFTERVLAFAIVR